MRDNFGNCPGCGGPLAPLFLSLVCRQECDLGARPPLQLDQTEGDSVWAGRMMLLDSGATMRCVSCCCPGAGCEGREYRVNNYTGHVMHMARSAWTWTRVPAVSPDNIDVWFPLSFPAHRWRKFGG